VVVVTDRSDSANDRVILDDRVIADGDFRSDNAKMSDANVFSEFCPGINNSCLSDRRAHEFSVPAG
jgi:hypothetical protein